MSEYKPIPVAEAAQIGERYGKDQVLIFAWDRESGLVHTTTWGRSPEDKLAAAKGGDLVAELLAGNTSKTSYEDFRG